MPSNRPVVYEKTGYISECSIEMKDEIRDVARRLVFFMFTVTDDVAGNMNPVTFVLSRDSQWPSDDPANNWKGIPFSGVQVAAVATLKDAYLQRKRVIATGTCGGLGILGRPVRPYYELTKLVLSDRDGNYWFTTQAPSQSIDRLGNRVVSSTAGAGAISNSSSRAAKSRAAKKR
jgi:hypothetical protein